MSDLSKRLEDELAEFLYTGVAEFNGIENGNFPLARKILALPSLKETIEKASLYETTREASKYDKLFEELRVEKKCGCTVTITSAKAFCSLCNGTGRVVRELTKDEKKEGR